MSINRKFGEQIKTSSGRGLNRKFGLKETVDKDNQRPFVGQKKKLKDTPNNKVGKEKKDDSSREEKNIGLDSYPPRECQKEDGHSEESDHKIPDDDDANDLDNNLSEHDYHDVHEHDDKHGSENDPKDHYSPPGDEDLTDHHYDDEDRNSEDPNDRYDPVDAQDDDGLHEYDMDDVHEDDWGDDDHDHEHDNDDDDDDN